MSENRAVEAASVLISVSGQREDVMKRLRSLRYAAGREKLDAFLLQGAAVIRRALEWGAEVEALVISESLAKESGDEVSRWRGSPRRVYVASAGLLLKAVGGKPAPNAVAIIRRRHAEVDALCHSGALLLVTSSLSNASNLGLALRSVDGAGGDGVILSGAQSADPWDPRSTRGSRGALSHLPVHRARDSLGVISVLKKNGVKVVATTANGGVPIDEIDLTGPVAVKIGNESTGLPREQLDAADVIAEISMCGRINSLNVAVAASIALFEARRQRKKLPTRIRGN